MLSHCLKCIKNKESKNPRVAEKKRNERRMPIWKYALCNSKNSKFVKQQQASESLSTLRIKTSLDKIPLLDSLLF